MALLITGGSSYHGSDAVGCRGADGVMVRVSSCIDSTVTREEQGRGAGGGEQLKWALADQPSQTRSASFPRAPSSPMRPSQLPDLPSRLEGRLSRLPLCQEGSVFCLVTWGGEGLAFLASSLDSAPSKT